MYGRMWLSLPEIYCTFRGLKDRETFVVLLQVNSSYKCMPTFFMAPLCHLFSSVRSESTQAVPQAPKQCHKLHQSFLLKRAWLFPTHTQPLTVQFYFLLCLKWVMWKIMCFPIFREPSKNKLEVGYCSFRMFVFKFIWKKEIRSALSSFLKLWTHPYCFFVF